MKKYVIEITILEGSDEYWEGLEKDGLTGCDEIIEMVKQSEPLNTYDFEIKLKSYSNE